MVGVARVQPLSKWSPLTGLFAFPRPLYYISDYLKLPFKIPILPAFSVLF